MDDFRNTVLGVTVPLDELPIAFRFLERVQILALDILDQRQLGGRGFVELANDRGDRVQLRLLGRTPAPLAGDDHVILAVRPEQDRLEDAALADRLRQLVERGFVELHARLFGVAADARDFDFAYAAAAFGLLSLRRGRPARFAEQGL